MGTDSFCSSYQKIIQQRGDASIMANTNVKKRIAANDVTYACVCEGWKDPICSKGIQ